MSIGTILGVILHALLVVGDPLLAVLSSIGDALFQSSPPGSIHLTEMFLHAFGMDGLDLRQKLIDLAYAIRLAAFDRQMAKPHELGVAVSMLHFGVHGSVEAGLIGISLVQDDR